MCKTWAEFLNKEIDQLTEHILQDLKPKEEVRERKYIELKETHGKNGVPPLPIIP